MRISDWSSDVCSSDLEFRRLGDQVDEAADRPLTEEHRGRTTYDLHAGEVVRVRRDARIIGEDIAHPVTELERVDAADVEAVHAGVAAIGVRKDAGSIFHRVANADRALRSEEQTSEPQSLMRISYAGFCL